MPVLEPWLVEASRRRVAEFVSQLSTLTDGSERVPNLEWTVADLAQHVACLPSFWHGHHQAGDHFEHPPDFAAYSDQQRSHITETDPQALAALITDEFDRFLTELAGRGPQWLYGIEATPSHMCGLVLNELIMHGRDLAAVTGNHSPMYEGQEANAAVDAMMLTTPIFIDPDKAAAQPDGVYHVHFRGGDDYTWTKRGAELTINLGRPAKADARLNADPATFLLSSLGRISQVRAGLSGKIVAYGKRPWRFMGLGTIAIDGV